MHHGHLTERPVVTALFAAGEDPPPALKPLDASAEVRVVSDAAALRRALPDTDVLVVWDFRTTVLQQAWSSAARLRWLHACSAGVDAVLFPELVGSDVTVTNARGVFDRPMAEYVLGLLLAFAKDLPRTLDLQRREQWRHRETAMLRGRTLLVVGTGGIGREIARLCGALDLAVHGVARTARDDDPDFGTISAAADLLPALDRADIVVAAAPLTADTSGMFDERAFAAMRPGSWFVNVGRGALVDEDALLGVLRSGRLAAAALDVFRDEPLPAGHPFWDLPNVIVSPHMSGDFIGWRDALAELFLENFARWGAGEPLRNVVDKRRGYAASSKTG